MRAITVSKTLAVIFGVICAGTAAAALARVEFDVEGRDWVSLYFSVTALVMSLTGMASSVFWFSNPKC